MNDGYSRFEAAKAQCNACPLRAVYNRVVGSDGCKQHPKVVVVGEAPGADEVTEGRPFVGRAGKILRGALNDYGFRKGNTLITNTIPCRPPDNNYPVDRALVSSCMDRWLRPELSLLQPEIILLLGGKALKAVLGMDGITKLRGQWFHVDIGECHAAVMPTFHPSYVLRTLNAGDTDTVAVWHEDLIAVAQRAGFTGGISPRSA